MPTTPPPPSSSPSPSTASSKAPPAIPIAISVICAVLLLSLMLITFHLRRRNKKAISAAQARKGREAQAGETVSRTHPAALMITPVEGKGTPRFVHTPGTNMRIATRRADGAWEFADPRAPFTPAIIADEADAALTATRNSSAASVLLRASSPDSRAPSPSQAQNSPYSHASYGPGSSTDLLPPPTAASASPWGAPTTPRTADSDLPDRAPWRAVHSPTPSTSGSTFLPAPSISSSRPSSAFSSNDSFLDLEATEPTYADPFRSPKPSVTSARSARFPASPLRSPPASARASPEPTVRVPQAQSRASPLPRRGDEGADAAQSSHLRPPPQTPMTPAAFAKEAESRAAREIRRGYERVDRHSEYAEQDEGLPSY